MKKLILMVFLFAVTACSYKRLENKPLKIVVANDMHYAHQSMIGDHPRSQELSLKADPSRQIIHVFLPCRPANLKMFNYHYKSYTSKVEMSLMVV